MTEEKSRFIKFVTKKYTSLAEAPLTELISDNLLAAHTVDLPKPLLEEGAAFIQACFELRESSAYQDSLRQQQAAHGLIDPGNKSIMMSYDFHVAEDGRLKLIEINTNAAFLTMGLHLYQALDRKLPVPFAAEELRDSVLEEMRLFGRATQAPSTLIIDEKPERQNLYAEFLLNQALFRSWGWPCAIQDFREPLPKTVDFVYNRYTDFYLEKPESASLREAFLQKTACFSPNPFEYFLLADKERLTEWSAGLAGFTKADTIQKNLLRSWEVTPENKEDLWSRRKKLFFKPAQEHGSKGSFRGATISHRTFDELIHKKTLAQEYVPAPELEFSTAAGAQKFKYDLRFYAYRGQLQLVLARLYQGQTTNLRTPGGGFACVEIR